jgi:hypothetical protein
VLLLFSLAPILLVLSATSCKTNNNKRDWNKGAKFQNLKIGDDLSDKSASFDIMSEPYTATVDQLPVYSNVNNIFINSVQPTSLIFDYPVVMFQTEILK